MNDLEWAKDIQPADDIPQVGTAWIVNGIKNTEERYDRRTIHMVNYHFLFFLETYQSTSLMIMCLVPSIILNEFMNNNMHKSVKKYERL